MLLMDIFFFYAMRLFTPKRHEEYLNKCKALSTALKDVGCTECILPDGSWIKCRSSTPTGLNYRAKTWLVPTKQVHTAMEMALRLKSLIQEVDNIDYEDLIFVDDGDHCIKQFYTFGESTLRSDKISEVEHFLKREKRKISDLEKQYYAFFYSHGYLQKNESLMVNPEAFRRLKDEAFKETYFRLLREIDGASKGPIINLNNLTGKLVTFGHGKLGQVPEGSTPSCNKHGVFIPVLVGGGKIESANVNNCTVVDDVLVGLYRRWLETFVGDAPEALKGYLTAYSYVRTLVENYDKLMGKQ